MALSICEQISKEVNMNELSNIGTNSYILKSARRTEVFPDICTALIGISKILHHYLRLAPRIAFTKIGKQRKKD